jgi:peroxiredoxin
VPSENFTDVDWAALPNPIDDGGTSHLTNAALPDVALSATDGSTVSLVRLRGRTVVFVYPMTGRPGVALPEGWDQIPGARGCTPQTCAFRDLYTDLLEAGASQVYGFSTQDTAYQQELVERLHLPFPLLSDSELAFSRASRLPMMSVEKMTLAKRLTFIIDDGIVAHVFYPVFPPDRNAGDVLAWLQANKRG